MAGISILASWYIEHDNYKHPVVVIIEDMDRCSGPVLSDFILMLSEWVIKILVILILGVATTLDASKSILTSKAVQHLSPSKFFLGSPADRLDAIIKAVLVKPCSGFLVGHRVAGFIRNCFLRQDETLTSLVGAVKCLHEAGKKQKTTLLDLYYEALDPKLYNLRHCAHLELKHDSQRPSWIQCINGTSSKMQKGGLIGQTIRQVRFSNSDDSK